MAQRSLRARGGLLRVSSNISGSCRLHSQPAHLPAAVQDLGFRVCCVKFRSFHYTCRSSCSLYPLSPHNPIVSSLRYSLKQNTVKRWIASTLHPDPPQPRLGRGKFLNGVNEPMFKHEVFKHFHSEPAQCLNDLNRLNVEAV